MHRLKIVQKWTETTATFKDHGAKAPVVYRHRVRLVLEQFRGLKHTQLHSFNDNWSLKKRITIILCILGKFYYVTLSFPSFLPITEKRGNVNYQNNHKESPENDAACQMTPP